MSIRDRLFSTVAGQLGHPRGPLGRLTGRLLNRGNRPVVAAALDALDLHGGETVADLGFGGGVGLALLTGRADSGRVLGVDLSHDMVAAARRRFRTHVAAGRMLLEQGSLDALPIADAALDAAITVNTFYFVADLERALAECARALRPGGRLVVGLGDPAAMRKMPFTAYGFRLRPVAEVVELLPAHGLALVDDRRLGDGEHAYHLLVCTRT